MFAKAVVDPDLQIRGGGAVIETLRKGGARTQKNFFSALQASVWSKNKWGGGGGAGPSGPSPGSATEKVLSYLCFSYWILLLKPKDYKDLFLSWIKKCTMFRKSIDAQ